MRILIDTSESMAVGGEDASDSKFAYACRLAASLCYVGLVRLETIVLQPFSDTLADSFRAHGGRLRYGQAAEYISKLETGGGTAFQRPVRDYLMKFPRPRDHIRAKRLLGQRRRQSAAGPLGQRRPRGSLAADRLAQRSRASLARRSRTVRRGNGLGSAGQP